MGMVINIDAALDLRSDYNILKEPLHEMMRMRQEAWERQNPIDLLFTRGTLSSFQDTYTSSIGFEHAFSESGDYALGPIFNTAEGFAATYRTRTFQGSFIISQQVIEDRQMGKAKDDANAFVKRWHGDIAEYAMAAIAGGYGQEYSWAGGSNTNGGSVLKLDTADTVDGKVNGVKNSLFSNAHTIVRRRDMSDVAFNESKQSNLFYADIDLAGSDPGKLAALADVINQVITGMENLKDDNNKRAGVYGAKNIVCANDPHLKASLETALSLEMFNEMGQKTGINPAYKRATVDTTPYLLDIPMGKGGRGFWVVDKAYNAENHGPEFTERIAFTLDVDQTKQPKGISYLGRQRFDINVASWRGMAYVHLGIPNGAAGTWNELSKYTKITPMSTIVKPVSIVGTVTTKVAP